MAGDVPEAPDLPPRPQPPVGYDCCGGGCADCDLTRYVKAMARWRAECKTLEEAANRG